MSEAVSLTVGCQTPVRVGLTWGLITLHCTNLHFISSPAPPDGPPALLSQGLLPTHHSRTLGIFL